MNNVRDEIWEKVKYISHYAGQVEKLRAQIAIAEERLNRVERELLEYLEEKLPTEELEGE